MTELLTEEKHSHRLTPALIQCSLIQVQQILTYEDSVAAHLSKILTSDQHSVVISSAKYGCLPVCLPACLSLFVHLFCLDVLCV